MRSPVSAASSRENAEEFDEATRSSSRWWLSALLMLAVGVAGTGIGLLIALDDMSTARYRADDAQNRAERLERRVGQLEGELEARGIEVPPPEPSPSTTSPRRRSTTTTTSTTSRSTTTTTRSTTTTTSSTTTTAPQPPPEEPPPEPPPEEPCPTLPVIGCPIPEG